MKKVFVLMLAIPLIATAGHAQSSDVLSQAAFGYAVATSGRYVFIGEPLNNRIPGRVYVFSKDGTTGQWGEFAVLHPQNDQVGNQFGSALAAENGLLAVSETDRIYIFRADAVGNWIEETSIVPDDSTEAYLGESLALSGGRLFATSRIDGQPVMVEVFEQDAAAAWRKTGTLELPIQAIEDIPVPIAVNDDLLLAGDLGSGRGRVYVFSQADGNLSARDTLGGYLTDADTLDDFGAAIAFDNGSVLVGAPETRNGAGAVLLNAQTDLTMSVLLKAETLEDDAMFGAAIAVDGSIAVVGAPADLYAYGSAFIYERAGVNDTWSLSSNVRASLGDGFQSIVGGSVQCEEGAAAGFDCGNVDIESFLSIESLGLDRGMQTNDVWGWTDPESGKEYAIVCSFAATTFIDVSDPNNPVVLGNLAATPGTRPNWWRDAKTYQHYAYIVADNVGEHGLQIFDLNQLRDVDNPPVMFEPTAHYDGFESAHNVIINEETGFAYVVGINGGGQTCGGGSHILDLKDPLNPKFAGCFAHPGTNEGEEGATHDAQCVTYHGPDERFTGREICIGSNGDAISIADFTDKANVIPVAVGRYPNSSYTHQGWLTEDHRYFYQNDETDELDGLTDGTRTMIWDLAELDDPVLMNMHVSENKATDHNYYISGSYMYQSNYLSGLRILDISDPERPVEVGYFDTVPWSEDKPGFGGSWSNYPFFKSGTIVVGSQEEGVFFLKRSDVTP